MLKTLVKIWRVSRRDNYYSNEFTEVLRYKGIVN